MNQPEAFVRLYSDAITFARETGQTVGEENDYYVTLQQLENLMRPYIQLKEPPTSQ